MRISTKGRYATRIMLYLALHSKEGLVRKEQISKAENISAAYVEQIMMMLKSANLTLSKRGVKGGFSLAREKKNILLLDILEATEGPLDLVPCIRGSCERSLGCAAGRVWKRANNTLNDFFKGISLDDLAREENSLRDSVGITYEI